MRGGDRVEWSEVGWVLVGTSSGKGETGPHHERWQLIYARGMRACRGDIGTSTQTTSTLMAPSHALLFSKSTAVYAPAYINVCPYICLCR